MQDQTTLGPSGISSGIIDLETSPPVPDTTNWPTVSTYAPTDLSSSSDGTPIPDDPAPGVGSDVHVRDASPPRKRKTAARGTALATASFRNGTSIPALGPQPTDDIIVTLGHVESDPDDKGVVEGPTLLKFEAKACRPGRHHHRAPVKGVMNPDVFNNVIATARFSTQFVKNTDPMLGGTLGGAHWRIAFDDLSPGRWWMRVNHGVPYRFTVPRPKSQ